MTETASGAKKAEPPLVEVKVTNPLTYIKKWWEKVINNEGIDFNLKVRPLTAIAIAIVVASLAFGVGRFVLPPGIKVPFFQFKYEENAIPTPTSTPASEESVVWKDTAYTGTLRFSEETNKYYLVTTSSEAIKLEVPETINMHVMVGKRIFAAGKYNKTTRVLVVFDVKDTEVLSKTPLPLPTFTPVPTSTQTPSPAPTSSPEILE